MEIFSSYAKCSRQQSQRPRDVVCAQMQDREPPGTLYLSGNCRETIHEDMPKISQPGVNLKGGYYGIRHTTGAADNVPRPIFKDTLNGIRAHEVNERPLYIQITEGEDDDNPRQLYTPPTPPPTPKKQPKDNCQSDMERTYYGMAPDMSPSQLSPSALRRRPMSCRLPSEPMSLRIPLYEEDLPQSTPMSPMTFRRRFHRSYHQPYSTGILPSRGHEPIRDDENAKCSYVEPAEMDEEIIQLKPIALQDPPKFKLKKQGDKSDGGNLVGNNDNVGDKIPSNNIPSCSKAELNAPSVDINHDDTTPDSDSETHQSHAHSHKGNESKDDDAIIPNTTLNEKVVNNNEIDGTERSSENSHERRFIPSDTYLKQNSLANDAEECSEKKHENNTASYSSRTHVPIYRRNIDGNLDEERKATAAMNESSRLNMSHSKRQSHNNLHTPSKEQVFIFPESHEIAMRSSNSYLTSDANFITRGISLHDVEEFESQVNKEYSGLLRVQGNPNEHLFSPSTKRRYPNNSAYETMNNDLVTTNDTFICPRESVERYTNSMSHNHRSKNKETQYFDMDRMTTFEDDHLASIEAIPIPEIVRKRVYRSISDMEHSPSKRGFWGEENKRFSRLLSDTHALTRVRANMNTATFDRRHTPLGDGNADEEGATFGSQETDTGVIDSSGRCHLPTGYYAAATRKQSRLHAGLFSGEQRLRINAASTNRRDYHPMGGTMGIEDMYTENPRIRGTRDGVVHSQDDYWANTDGHPHPAYCPSDSMSNDVAYMGPPTKCHGLGTRACACSVRDTMRTPKRGDIDVRITCTDTTEKTTKLREILSQLDHNDKNCRCFKVEDEILHMARDAFHKIRRKDDSLDSFNQFQKELDETNKTIQQAMEILCSFKSLCKHGRTIEDIFSGSVVIRLNCPDTNALMTLWEDYLSGDLTKMVNDVLVTKSLLDKFETEKIVLKVSIAKECFESCRDGLEETEKNIITDEKCSTDDVTSEVKLTEVNSNTKQSKPIDLNPIHSRSVSAPVLTSLSPTRSPLSPYNRQRIFSFSSFGRSLPQKSPRKLKPQNVPVIMSPQERTSNYQPRDSAIPATTLYSESKEAENTIPIPELNSPTRKTRKTFFYI